MLSHLVSFTNTIRARMNRDETGATAVEYGIMVALIAVAIIVVVTTLGGNLSDTFSDVADKVAPKTTTTTPGGGS